MYSECPQTYNALASLPHECVPLLLTYEPGKFSTGDRRKAWSVGVHVAANIKKIVEARLKEHIPATDLPD